MVLAGMKAIHATARTEARKIQDPNGARTRDPATPARRSNQPSHEATDVGSWSFATSTIIAHLISHVQFSYNCDSFDKIKSFHPLLHSSWEHYFEPTDDHLPLSVASWLGWLERPTAITGSQIQTHIEALNFQASLCNCYNYIHNCEGHSFT